MTRRDRNERMRVTTGCQTRFWAKAQQSFVLIHIASTHARLRLSTSAEGDSIGAKPVQRIGKPFKEFERVHLLQLLVSHQDGGVEGVREGTPPLKRAPFLEECAPVLQVAVKGRDRAQNCETVSVKLVRDRRDRLIVSCRKL